MAAMEDNYCLAHDKLLRGAIAHCMLMQMLLPQHPLPQARVPQGTQYLHDSQQAFMCLSASSAVSASNLPASDTVTISISLLVQSSICVYQT